MLLPLAALLLGMVPLQDDGVLDGPPAPHLDRRTAVQWRLSSRPAWRAFQAAWDGRWAARWDERNGTPRFLYAPGVPLSEVDTLVADVARLGGADPDGFQLTGEVRRGQEAILRWTRTWRGAEVVGDEVVVVSEGERIGGVWARITPIGALPEPRDGEVVLPVPRFPDGQDWIAPSNGIRPVLGTVERDDTLVTWLDRLGRVLLRYDERRYGAVTVTHEERTVGGAVLEDPAREVTVTDASGATDITDTGGLHDLTGALTVSLQGPSLWVVRNSATVRVSGSGDIVLDGGSDLSWASADTLHNFHVVWDWLQDRWPTHRWLDRTVVAYVDATYGYCNAWYSGGTLTFLVEYPYYCNNFGRIADVLYHEVGHGIHEYILAGGTFAGDVSEGAGDYTSCTVNGDPYLAPNAYYGGGYVREIATDRVYPWDVVGEVHTDGLIFGSFLWDVREAWTASMGEEAGARAADVLFLGTLEQGPTLTDVCEAVLLADDDDGDLSDGTPHACELVDLLDAHGLGPGPIGVLVFDHEPLGDQPSAADAYPVRFTLYDLTEGCGGLDRSSVRLRYTTSDLPAPGTAEAGGGDPGAVEDPAEGWVDVTLSEAGGDWAGLIPRQVATTRVRYYVQASSTDAAETVYTHDGRDEGVWAFWIGDQQRIWCEGFEADAPDWVHRAGTPDAPDTSGAYADEWTYGTPNGAGQYDPDAPWEGTKIAATALDGDYRNNNLQFLRSPTLDLAGAGPMLMLSYRRWLTVEDGIYDHARLYAGSTLVYENHATSAGNDHVLDMDWTLHDIPLEGLLDEKGRVAFTWTLSSDPGLEFGGWALDDVCVVALADVPGHYRVDDLAATDDADVVSITWTQPWMPGLTRTVLVRKLEGWPTGPDDGEVLDIDPAPVPGTARAVSDPNVAFGEWWYYAIFTADTSESFYLDVVEGENADRGGVGYLGVDTSEWGGDTGEAPVDDTAAPADTGEPPGDDDECGCGSATPRAGWTPAALLALLLLRRRRPGPARSRVD